MQRELQPALKSVHARVHVLSQPLLQIVHAFLYHFLQHFLQTAAARRILTGSRTKTHTEPQHFKKEFKQQLEVTSKNLLKEKGKK